MYLFHGFFKVLNNFPTTTCSQHNAVHSSMDGWAIFFFFYINKGERYWVKTKAKKIVLSEVNTLLLFSCSVMFDSLWPHGLQPTRLPYPSLSLRACSNSCPSSRWCHPTISSSVVSFSSCPQSFPASGSFPMSKNSYFQWVTKNKCLVTYKTMFKEVHMTLYK